MFGTAGELWCPGRPVPLGDAGLRQLRAAFRSPPVGTEGPHRDSLGLGFDMF